MGCRISSHENVSPTSTMSRNIAEEEVDYKSRLERKICLAKETPEPIYDLSNCNLKDVPPGVFIMCKVLRKESLILSNNKLNSLNGGGMLNDLQLLHTLNLSKNRFKKLPEDIYKLENLRELFISNNFLEYLPKSINRLKKLEILDISDNNLSTIEQISFMPNLRILNIGGNDKLIKLPNQLSTCDNLVDIILNSHTIQEPPADIVSSGTYGILKYLTTGEFLKPDDTDSIQSITKKFINNEKNEGILSNMEKEKHEKEKMLLERERLAYEKDYFLENQLHEQQQKKKHEFLQQLLKQQNQAESNVMRLQEEKQSERQKLINDILQDEEHASVLVDKLLSLKNGPDPAFLEKERLEHQYLTDRLRIQQDDLRKHEILTAMTDLLENEINVIQNFHNQRDQSSRSILEQEFETNHLLDNIFISYDKNRQEIINKVNYDEEIQKSAVATLIAKNDSRSWALMEQVRIVESQLAVLTLYEIERRKTSIDGQLIDIADHRINLTIVLMNLLEQQDQRKKQLVETLQVIENQKQQEQSDFWLLQYQKLIDCQPVEITTETSSIDPILGYNFLLNDVVHCIPFLSKIWQNKEKHLMKVTNADLLDAGVVNERDRVGILKSIQSYYSEYLNKNMESMVGPSAPNLDDDDDDDVEVCAGAISPTSSTAQPEPSHINSASTASPKSLGIQDPNVQLAECVVCMEETVQVIFLPCGHMCCCSNCQTSLTDCPMCRAYIERKIRVIQP